MPSFFDYLRQRAYDAILQGAQEAFEHLENQCDSTSTKPLIGKVAKASGVETHETAASESDGPKESKEANKRELLGLGHGEKLPPPRKRGRPRGKRKRA